MGAQPFGQLIRQAMKDKELSQGRLGYLITRDDGPFYDASQVRLILQGKRRITRDLVEDLIKALDLPQKKADELWEASGLREEWVTADHVALLREIEQLDDEAAVGAVQRHRSARRRIRPVQADDSTIAHPGDRNNGF